MFEMSPSGTNAGVQTLPTLIDGIVNDALLHVGPDRDQTPLQLLHVVYSRLIQALLHHSLDLVVHWLQVWTVWWPKIWGDEHGYSSFKKANCLTGPVCQGTVLLKDEIFA